MEARKPQACGQCHLGPDHPQIEIFTESKHGDIYDAFGDEYNWTAAPGTWSPGVDFRGPTCASCHMSGAGSVMTSHDVTERLSWELQAPLTVRPEEFKALPAQTNWKERTGLKCRKSACSATEKDGPNPITVRWIKPSKNTMKYISNRQKAKLDELYEKGLLDKTRFFDEPLEVEYYELWHHEGRKGKNGCGNDGTRLFMVARIL